MTKWIQFTGIMACMWISVIAAHPVTYVPAPPLQNVVRVNVGDVKNPASPKIPIITWGGDIATILANGNSLTTVNGSLFNRQGLNLTLYREDVFQKQVEAFIQGDSPYLRGTLGMVNRAVEALKKDSRTEPVVIYQMTWSTGGDCLVVKDNIKTLSDLKGKTVVLQAFGPHEDLLVSALRTAGLSLNDITIKYTKDLTGTEETPGEALLSDSSVDAVMVIIPDGLALTSNGTTGTGAEGSVRGAKILFSTKTANRVIADVYAVRADYLQSHRSQVQNFVHGLMLAEQELQAIFKQRQSQMAPFNTMIQSAAQILLDSPQATEDATALFQDCSYVGFPGNVEFFGNPNNPRNFEKVTNEIQSAFVTAGLLSRTNALTHAKWDYNTMKEGILNAQNVEAPRFDVDKVAEVVSRKQQMGTLSEGELYSFEIFFQPNQKTFSTDLYQDSFERVIEYSSTYGGAIITIEGHADPLGYLKQVQAGESEIVLKQIKQASKNLSLSRANEVRDNIINFAKQKNITLDAGQLTSVGHGFIQPKTGVDAGGEPLPPKTKEDWLSNMRVVFRIIQVEAEASEFEIIGF